MTAGIGIATKAIPKARPTKKLIKRHYRTNDIVDLTQYVATQRVRETEKFSRNFTADEAGMRKLFRWCDRHIRYVADPPENQWLQSPSWLNETQEGDCKSITALQSTVMSNLGMPHKIRYVSYDGGEYTHVYPVAILDGEEVPMDVVWKKQAGGPFGQEKPYKRKRDCPMKGLYLLGSTTKSISGPELEAAIGEMETTLSDIERAQASIPDLVNTGWGDVTRMQGGKVDRMIMADRYAIHARLTVNPKRRAEFLAAKSAMEKGSISGIHGLDDNALATEVRNALRIAARNTAPAVKPIDFNIPSFPPLQGKVSGFFKNLWKKAKNVVKKVGDAIGMLFKKFTNWFFKSAAKGSAPFYIFKVLKGKEKFLSPEINKRIAEQEKTYEHIKRVGKYEDRQMMGLVLNGILEKTGKTPEQIAAEGGLSAAVGIVPVVAPVVAKASVALVPKIIKAVSWVLKIIGKLASIFKPKNKPGRTDETTMSDPRLFAEEARLRALKNNPAGGAGGSLLPLAAAGALLAIKFI